MVIVRGNIGNGIIGCGDGGGVLRFRWLVMAALIILMTVSLVAMIVGEDVGVVMVVVREKGMSFLAVLPFLLYILGHSISHRV